MTRDELKQAYADAFIGLVMENIAATSIYTHASNEAESEAGDLFAFDSEA